MRIKDVYPKESDLFPIIKKHFKDMGYTVYAEVAAMYRGVDLVAVKGEEHIAVELKLSFNDGVCHQAMIDTQNFDKVYVAFPVPKAIFYHQESVFWKVKESIQRRYTWLENRGIGMLQVLPSGMVYEDLEPKQQTPYRKLDLQHYIESDDDLGGVPFQRGVSEGYHELESIKKYVTANPNANWREIYDNVSNHYSSHTSMAGAMRQWRGFSLQEFKSGLIAKPVEPIQESLI